MKKPSTEDVRALYSRFPYPSPLEGDLYYDVADLFSVLGLDHDLGGRRILDAGCGTGQRTLGCARRFPNSTFLGVDVTGESLKIAASLAHRYGIRNITFECHDILHLNLGEQFDVIVSAGVVHHLSDPTRGVANLCRHLAPEGILCVWHYHPFGESARLAQRELLLTLWGKDHSDLERGRRLMHKLRLQVPAGQYASSVFQRPMEIHHNSVNVDAFMHPIVNAYRFLEGMSLFFGSGMDWVAVNTINIPGQMKLVDLERAEESEDLAEEICIRDEDLFDDSEVRDTFRCLGKVERLKAIELMLRPTGFSLVAGRSDSRHRCGKRIAGNAVELASLSEQWQR